MPFLESLQAMLPEGYPVAILWVGLALVLLVVVLFLIRILRRFGSGTFVAGGRNRRTRLAVMDAAAIDSRRRLVLVRRDDVEHLLLIGGPTDVVVEHDIRLMARPQARPAEHPEQQAPRPGPSQAEVDRARAQVRPPPPARHAEPPRPIEPPPPARPAAAPQAVLPRPTMPMSAPPPPPGVVAPKPADAPRNFEYPKVGSAESRTVAKDLDTTLLNELEVSLDPKPSAAPRKPDVSLDEQMNRLLGEITKKT
jgi:flagellar biogenesis protein FliO